MSAIANLLVNLLQLFNFLLVVWCLLTWFPAVKWQDQPFRTLDMIIRPVIEPFRRVLPPIAGFDFSPVIAILCINYLVGFLIKVL
ncbi:MAG: YggT family protein [Cyanobacteria bacterium HKST-UBA02]|nr:YggT family protein [Cyanobacteria bacterium HKST-UBA02]